MTFLVAFVVSLAASSPISDAAQLRQGVSEIAAPGVPGPLVVAGGGLFPVVAAPDGAGGMQAVVAAGRVEKGRVVAFGHTGYLDRAAIEPGDTKRLLLNAVRWAAGTKGLAGVRITVVDSDGVADLLGQEGAIVERGRRVSASALGQSRVLVAPATDLGDIAAVRRYLERGGGLVTASLGWGWKQLNPGKDLATEHPGNALLGPYGLLWADGTLERNATAGFLAGDPPRWTQALRALDLLFEATDDKGVTRGAFEEEDVTGAAGVVGSAIRNLPPGEHILLERLDPVRKRLRGALCISSKKPVAASQGLVRVLASLDARDHRLLSPQEIRPHPSAEEFPGLARGKKVEKTVPVRLDRPGWQGTGLYAPPGEIVEIVVPEKTEGISARIGCHKDTLWHKETWSRFPEITRTFELDPGRNRVACAFGGLVYLESAGTVEGATLVQIKGAIEAPRFVLGKDDAGEWRSRLRTLPGPWAELETGKIIVTVPSDHVRELDDPESLLRLWDRIADSCRELLGLAADRDRPERYVADVQISAGYMHAGYPIMTHLDAAETMVSEEMLLAGAWGLYHELGHNHQDSLWTFSGTGEVTCNLFTLYLYEKVCGIGPGDSRMRDDLEGDKRRERLRKYREAGARFDDWKRDPFLALLTYVQLREAFGWEAYRKVFASYRESPPEGPMSDDRKRDEWLIRFSRVVGRDLGPFFEWWGIPVSAEARRAVADLPVWLPEECGG
jgi:hypothetical protein